MNPLTREERLRIGIYARIALSKLNREERQDMKAILKKWYDAQEWEEDEPKATPPDI